MRVMTSPSCRRAELAAEPGSTRRIATPTPVRSCIRKPNDAVSTVVFATPTPYGGPGAAGSVVVVGAGGPVVVVVTADRACPAAGVAATAVPAGRVTVTGRLARSETDADTGVPPLTDAPAGRAYRVNSEELGALLPYPVHGGYLSLLAQQPPSAVAPAVAAAACR